MLAQKVLCVLTLNGKRTRALTFENVGQARETVEALQQHLTTLHQDVSLGKINAN